MPPKRRLAGSAWTQQATIPEEFRYAVVIRFLRRSPTKRMTIPCCPNISVSGVDVESLRRVVLQACVDETRRRAEVVERVALEAARVRAARAGVHAHVRDLRGGDRHAVQGQEEAIAATGAGPHQGPGRSLMS